MKLRAPSFVGRTVRVALAVAGFLAVGASAPRADVWTIGIPQTTANVSSPKVSYLNIRSSAARQEVASAQAQVSYLNTQLSPARQDGGSASSAVSYLNVQLAAPRQDAGSAFARVSYLNLDSAPQPPASAVVVSPRISYEND